MCGVRLGMEVFMKHLSIVIADDNEEVRKSTVSFFEGHSQVVVAAVAADGEQAVQAVKRLNPAVLVLDMVMPKLDGYGVLQQLCKLDKKPYIICTSHFSSDSCINNAMMMGADFYMIKPVGLDGLERHIVNAFCQPQKIELVPVRKTEHKCYNRYGSSLEERLANIFLSVGIPAHIKGYQFLREGIKLTIETPEIINSITKKLYPKIAEKFDTSASKVERAIRHAIEVAWNRGRIENINSMFGMKVYNSNDKPTNGEFIALIADKLLVERL